MSRTRRVRAYGPMLQQARQVLEALIVALAAEEAHTRPRNPGPSCEVRATHVCVQAGEACGGSENTEPTLQVCPVVLLFMREDSDDVCVTPAGTTVRLRSRHPPNDVAQHGPQPQRVTTKCLERLCPGNEANNMRSNPHPPIVVKPAPAPIPWLPLQEPMVAAILVHQVLLTHTLLHSR
jgi:hypothetical protein